MNMAIIDLTTQPPTTETIVSYRTATTQLLTRLMTWRRRLRWGRIVFVVLVAATPFYLWWNGMIPGAVAAFATFAIAAVLAGLSGAAVLAVAAAIVVVLAVPTVTETAVAGVMSAAVLSGAFTTLLVVAVYKWIDPSIEQANFDLTALADLEHRESPDECVDFVKWCDHDATIKAYQHRLAEMGRRPIRAEYEAAKKWIKTADTRRAQAAKDAQAQAACERLAGAV